MSSQPQLTVAMPAYNASPYIGRAIESILSQTMEDLELIIVDDQSTDDTWDIIQRYADADDRITAVRNEINSGAASSINRAIRLGSAPYIAGMDADDISVPHRMAVQRQFLEENSEVAVVGSFVSHVNDRDEILSLSRTGPTSIGEFEELRLGGEPTMVFGGTAMYRRETFEKVGGFDSSLRAAADIDFCERVADHGAIIALKEPLLLYRVYGTSNVMLRFREGRRTHRYLVARRRARLAGEPAPTRETFAQIERDYPWWRRLNIWRDDFAQYNYRRAGLAYAEDSRLRTAFYLVISGIADPWHVLRRIWDQRLSPEARRIRS